MQQIQLFREQPLLADKIELTPTSLEIIGELDEQELDMVWEKMAYVHGGTQWWIGDLYNQSNEEAKSIATKHGFERKSIYEYAQVCRNITIRMVMLSFGHHQVVANMEPADQQEWLQRATNNEWTVAQFREEIKAREREQNRLKRLAAAPAAPKWNGKYQPNNIYLADTTNIEFINSMPKESMDMVFTDPPWEEGALICYETVGRLANRTLKPGGFVAIYCGKMFLPEILSMLSSWLDYVWMYCVFQPDNNWQMTRANVGIFEAWRPIALFRKPGDYREKRFAPDALKCTRQKSWHEWQQGNEPVIKYIELLTEPGDIVCDPFVGGGTIPHAAQQLKRHYLAFDKDEDTVRLALARLDGR